MPKSSPITPSSSLGRLRLSQHITYQVDAVLCPYCRDLASKILAPRNKRNTKVAGPPHHDTTKALIESADQCQLCNLIAREFGHLAAAPTHYCIVIAQEKTGVSFWVQRKRVDDDDDDSDDDETRIALRFRLRQQSNSNAAADKSGNYELGKLLVDKTGLVPVADSYPDTAGVLEPVRRLMADCSTRHETCSRSTSALPKRVLDISRPDHSVALYESKGETVPYATLSYCWGGDVPLRTLTTNFAQHVQGISLEAFPRTLRDVVPFARSLGFRYLWIDALCIIQDDPLDWKDQAAAMTTIYYGCSLNIAVADSPSCDSGVTRTLQQHSIHLATSAGPDKSAGRTKIAIVSEPVLPDRYEPETSLISTRGWVFQETLVSRATVYICHHGIFWDCCAKRYWQSEPWIPSPGPSNGGMRNRTMKASWALSDREWSGLERGEKQSHLYRNVNLLWALYNWVAHLSRRRLSLPKDKLPALAGLASRLAAATSATYVAGLWREDLLLGLTWYAKGSGPKTRYNGRAPSWSWASLDGEVCWLRCVSIDAQYPAYIEADPELDLEILDVVVDEVFPGSFGEVRGARITAVGTLHAGSFCSESDHDPDPESDAGSDVDLVKMLKKPKFHVPFNKALCCLLDEQQSSGDSLPSKCYLLRLVYVVAKGASDRGPYLTFLILEETGQQENEFRRIGFAYTDRRKRFSPATTPPDEFKGGERRRITLV